VFVTKNGKYGQLTLFLFPKETPCLFPSMKLKGMRDRGRLGQKWPAALPGALKSGDFRTERKSVKMACFFFVKQSFLAIGWFGHLALVVPRDGELPELTKPW
jgi:hypothetical protein